MNAPRPDRLRRLGPTALLAAVTAVALAALAGCSSVDRKEPATVTLPENNTTTTAPLSTEAPPSTSPDTAEPLPVAWTVQVGGTGNDTLEAVVGDQATVVAVGTTDAGIATPALGGRDVLTAVVSTDGEVQSATQTGTTADDSASGVGANEAAVLVCGSTAGALGAPSAGQLDAWCGPLLEDGNVGQTKQLGGLDSDEITGASLGDDEIGYASGTLSGLLPGAQDPAGRGLGAGDALALQTSPAGEPIWARQFGTAAADGALGVTTSEDGDGIFVGFTDGELEGPSNGARDGWISRFDSSGNQRWVTQIGSTGSDSLAAVAAAGEARRGTEQFIAAGSTDGDLDGPSAGVAAGATDATVASFGSDGALLWTAQFGSAGADDATAIVADGTTVYVAGTTAGGFGELIEDGGPGGAQDGFLTAIDAPSGQVLWTSRFGSTSDDLVTGITTTEDGLLVVSGTTAGQIGEAPANGALDGFLIAFPLASAGGGAASSV